MTKPAESASSDESLLTVVGVGASAGGVEALQEFFGGNCEAKNVAFVVATHMMADKPSMLPEYIELHTSLTVQRAVDNLTVVAGCVYVLQPGELLSLKQGRLQVAASRAGDHVRDTIDRLFGSLASEFGHRAMGVGLSGTGTDGAMGCRAIRDRGGLTMAQIGDEGAVRFTGMPSTAIAVRAIDLQLPAGGMMERISNYAASLAQKTRELPRQSLFDQVCRLLHRYSGHDFSGYKPTTFWRRVARRMQVLQLNEIEAYIARVEAVPEEATQLFRDLLISVTSFFRDSDAFAALQKEVIPVLFSERAPAESIRIWVPGCATGEEAYSLAIVLLEQARTLQEAPDVKIFATDIDEDALAIARAGRYPAALLEAVSPERRERFFTNEQGGFVIAKAVRDLCTFSAHSVLKDPPFSRIDVVSCSNLLIYLSLKTQDQLMPIFHFALRPSGYLFVGTAESVSRHGELFTPVNRKYRIFQRVASAAPRMALPLTSAARRRLPQRESMSSPRGSTSLRRSLEAHILRKHMPAHVLINERGEVVYFSSSTKGFLEHAAGAPSRQLLISARQELRLGLRRALKETLSAGQPSSVPRTALE